MVNWSAHTKHTLPFNSTITTQDKTKACKRPTGEDKGAQACRRVRPILKMGKVRKARINDG